MSYKYEVHTHIQTHVQRKGCAEEMLPLVTQAAAATTPRREAPEGGAL